MNGIEVVNDYTQVVCVNTGTSFEDGYTSKIIRSKTNVPQPDIIYRKLYLINYSSLNVIEGRNRRYERH